MDKSVGILVIMFIVVVSGKYHVLTLKQEVQYAEQNTPSSDESARMIHQLANGIQLIQKLSTAHEDENFMCMACEEMMTFVYNVSVDKGLLVLVQNFVRQYACTYMCPAGFKAECNAYVDDIPDLIIAFANTYLNPNQCAYLCSSSEMNQQLNVLGNIVNKMDGASQEDVSK